MNHTSDKMESSRAGGIVSGLLGWYDENKRELPWRHTSDPYRIWVCEIMAQQTRITALLPYYRRFVEAFPTVEALAQADPDDVLKEWEGLGYYARAHNLQKTAQIVVQKFGGCFPATEKELMALPGIGEYTAGALLSIAFGIPTAAVDGNVLRVFARLENDGRDITLPAAKEAARSFVSALIPPQRAGCFTQALMELGALVCLPKRPLCGGCPVRDFCRAYRNNTQENLPVKPVKKPVKQMDKTVFLICDPKGRVLVRKRTEKLLHGLWEFYMQERIYSIGEAKDHLKGLGYSVESIESAGHFVHVFTHMIWQMEGYLCRVAEDIEPKGYCFYPEIQKLAFPTALRFYLEFYQKHGRGETEKALNK